MAGAAAAAAATAPSLRGREVALLQYLQLHWGTTQAGAAAAAAAAAALGDPFAAAVLGDPFAAASLKLKACRTSSSSSEATAAAS